MCPYVSIFILIIVSNTYAYIRYLASDRLAMARQAELPLVREVDWVVGRLVRHQYVYVPEFADPSAS